MNISIIENIILNSILIIFPLLIYLVLNCYKQEITKKENTLLLSISLVTSLYLCLRFGTINNDSRILLFCNIPIVTAYIKKELKIGIVLSIINIIYCYFMFKKIMIIILIKYIIYIILYLYEHNKKTLENSFILLVAVIQGFFLSFEYFFTNITTSINDFLMLLLITFIYYFITFSVVYIFKTIEKIDSINDTLKTLQKDKTVKDALFKLTHELKNPLAVCKGYLEMIDINKQEKVNKYILIMREEINRSLNIMTDFLEFNKIKIKKEKLDLNYLLEDIYDSFKVLIKNRNIKLIYKNRKDEEIYIDGDYERLKQVIINILKNSYEAICEKGKIEIYSNIYKNHIDIVIEDNGIGMDEETLHRVKEMFYTTKKTGTGLGIALSNEIIESHSGKLIYYSQKNKGTKVTIRLPYK